MRPDVTCSCNKAHCPISHPALKFLCDAVTETGATIRVTKDFLALTINVAKHKALKEIVCCCCCCHFMLLLLLLLLTRSGRLHPVPGSRCQSPDFLCCYPGPGTMGARYPSSSVHFGCHSRQAGTFHWLPSR